MLLMLHNLHKWLLIYMVCIVLIHLLLHLLLLLLLHLELHYPLLHQRIRLLHLVCKRLMICRDRWILVVIGVVGLLDLLLLLPILLVLLLHCGISNSWLEANRAWILKTNGVLWDSLLIAKGTIVMISRLIIREFNIYLLHLDVIIGSECAILLV